MGERFFFFSFFDRNGIGKRTGKDGGKERSFARD